MRKVSKSIKALVVLMLVVAVLFGAGEMATNGRVADYPANPCSTHGAQVDCVWVQPICDSCRCHHGTWICS